jgi:hypothetical protein
MERADENDESELMDRAVATVPVPYSMTTACAQAKKELSLAKQRLLPYRVACLVACVRALKAMTPASLHAPMDAFADAMSATTTLHKWAYSSSETEYSALDGGGRVLWKALVTAPERYSDDCDVVTCSEQRLVDGEAAAWQRIVDSDAFHRFHAFSDWPYYTF